MIVVDTTTRDVVAAVCVTADLSASADACRVPQPTASTATAATITTHSRPRTAVFSGLNAPGSRVLRDACSGNVDARIVTRSARTRFPAEPLLFLAGKPGHPAALTAAHTSCRKAAFAASTSAAPP